MSVYTKKSDTVEERFAHLDIVPDLAHKATVFARKEADGYYASVAYCSLQDDFNRRIGRNVARRRYFSGGPRFKLGAEFTYEAAQRLADAHAPVPL